MAANRGGTNRGTMPSDGLAQKPVDDQRKASGKPSSKTMSPSKEEAWKIPKELEAKLKLCYKDFSIEKAAEIFIMHSFYKTKTDEAPPFNVSKDDLHSMVKIVDPRTLEQLNRGQKDGKVLRTSDGLKISIDELLREKKQDSNTPDLKRKLGDRKDELEEKDKELRDKDEKLKQIEKKLNEKEKALQETKDELENKKSKISELTETVAVREAVNKNFNKQVEGLLKEKHVLEEKKNKLDEENKHLCEKFDVEKQKLEDEIQDKNKIILGFETQIEQINQENTKLWNDVKQSEKKCQNLEGKLNRERRTIECMKEDHEDEIRKIHNQTKDLVAERDDLRNRFSKLAGAKLTDQNPDIADLSDPNRAMKLSDKFGELYDDQWTDAFESLQSKKKTAREAIDILLNVLKKCEDFFKKLREGQMDSLKNVLLHPSQDISTFGTDARKHVGGLKEHERLTSADKKAMRELRRQVGVSEGVLEEVKQVFLLETKKWEEKKLLESCTPYLQRCAELCWLIVTHDPPLYIKFDVKHGDHMDLNLYNRYSSKGSTIDYLVWPALFNEKDGGLLSKGTAEPIRTVKKD